MKTKIPQVYGYAVMADEKSPFYHQGQYAIFRLKRDAIAWRDKHYPNNQRDEFNQIYIKNVLVSISL